MSELWEKIIENFEGNIKISRTGNTFMKKDAIQIRQLK